MKIPLCVRCVLACFTLELATRAAESGTNVAAVPVGKIDRALVQKRYENGKQLARAGNHAGALNEFLWCYDEGMVEVASFIGVRGSFLLSDIERLASSFPPAREALIERCDAAERRASKDATDSRAVRDFAALCGALGDNVRLVRLFDALPKDDARRRGFGLTLFGFSLATAVTPMPSWCSRTNKWCRFGTRR
jgi:hypothetical protein